MREYIRFISNVIKFFIYNKKSFKIQHKIYSMKDIEIASNHFELNAQWDEVMDIIEYFSFSDINIEKENGIFNVEILDESFDKSVLISNFRENNYTASLNDKLSLEAKMQNLKFKGIHEETNYLSLKHCIRIFGVESLSNEIEEISIDKWMSAYFFIKEQAIKKIKKRKEIASLEGICVVKTFYWWRRQLTKYNSRITIEEADKIIKMFIYDKNSKDLIDNPLLQFENYLVLIPSIASNLAADRALVSLLANKNVQINFKGYAFEKRLQKN